MNYSDDHFLIPAEHCADESTEDERALEGKYLFDRGNEVQKAFVAEENDEEIGDDDDENFS